MVREDFATGGISDYYYWRSGEFRLSLALSLFCQWLKLNHHAENNNQHDCV